jgi:hypothetical protein
MTVQSWFNFKRYLNEPLPSGNPVVLISIPNFITLNYQDETLTLIVTDDTQLVTTTKFYLLPSLTTFVDNWAHIAVTLKQYKWLVYVNSQPVITILLTKLDNYQNLDIK